MNPRRRVTVERNRLRFSAAHMATYHGELEPLHGHNYDIMVSIEGDLTEDGWVWDFGDLKRVVKALADELDHKFLLQLKSPLVTALEHDDHWEVSFRERRYVFPKSDVAALPIDNSTAERLAEWLAGRLVDHYRALAPGFREIEIGVEESPGQAGWFRVSW